MTKPLAIACSCFTVHKLGSSSGQVLLTACFCRVKCRSPTYDIRAVCNRVVSESKEREEKQKEEPVGRVNREGRQEEGRWKR